MHFVKFIHIKRKKQNKIKKNQPVNRENVIIM